MHGPPAVGKLTIGKALVRLIPGRLMDNHSSIDLAKTVMEFGAPGFWPLLHELRTTMLTAAAQSDLRYLITTNCYGHPEDLPLFEDYETILTAHGGRVRPVHLTATDAVLADRVGAPDRVERGKLTSQHALADHLARNAYVAVPRPDVITINTETTLPPQVAQQIIDALGLDPLDMFST